jgi:hypothetical protein
MDVEKTIEFILESHARLQAMFEAGADRAKEEAARAKEEATRAAAQVNEQMAEIRQILRETAFIQRSRRAS